MVLADPRDAASEFEHWYRRYSDDLRAYVSQAVAAGAVDDIVQETFARAWTHRDALAAGDHTKPWLFRVARNLCIAWYRTSGRLVCTASLPDLPSERDPTLAVIVAEEHQAVRAAFAALSPRDREMVALRDLDGVAYDVIAGRVGLTESGVRARLHRARGRLRDRVAGSLNGVAVGATAPRRRLGRLLASSERGGALVQAMSIAAAQVAVVAALTASVTATTMANRPSAPAWSPVAASRMVGPGGSGWRVLGERSVVARAWPRDQHTEARGQAVALRSVVVTDPHDARVFVDTDPGVADPLTGASLDTGVDVYRPGPSPGSPPGPVTPVCPPNVPARVC